MRCRDCLPYPFLCAGCDEKRHGSFFVLHNRDSLVSGFVQPLPPSTGFCQEAGQISVKHLGKIMLCLVVLLLFYCALNISCFKIYLLCCTVRLLPVEIPAYICDCSNGTVLVSSGRPMALITMNGKEDFCIIFFLIFITISLLSYNFM